MIIKLFACPPYATNAYIVTCSETKKSVVIDPAPKSTPLVCRYLSQNDYTLERILLTHSHWDHIADVAPLKKELDVPVYVHTSDKQNLEFPGSDKIPSLADVQGVTGALPLEEGQQILVGNLIFEIIHTPGHSPGGVCFYCKKKQVLFSGDTLFKGSIGTLSLPTASPEAMWNSLNKLSSLPSETKVYPGHGSSTTIGDESWLVNAKAIFSSR